jgi:hypothetical protein
VRLFTLQKYMDVGKRGLHDKVVHMEDTKGEAQETANPNQYSYNLF